MWCSFLTSVQFITIQHQFITINTLYHYLSPLLYKRPILVTGELENMCHSGVYIYLYNVMILLERGNVYVPGGGIRGTVVARWTTGQL